MIEIESGSDFGSSYAWRNSNPFEEGEVSSSLFDTFRTAQEFLRFLFWESQNSIKDGIKVGLDYAKASLEGTDLLFNPIYRDEDIPRGDGSDLTLVPGFMGNELFYLLPKENLRKVGWNANVYPPRYGLHVGPTESEVDPFVQDLKDTKKRSGRKGHVIAHSKGGHVALLAAVLRTEEFTDCVDQLILVGSPIPDRVNFQVGTGYLIAQALFRGKDFRLTAFADDDEALSRLNNVRLTTLKIIKDPVMDGLHLGSEDELIEVDSSHTGALQNRDNLLLVHNRLVRPISTDQEDRERIMQFSVNKAA